jgi:hypothetical protein
LKNSRSRSVVAAGADRGERNALIFRLVAFPKSHKFGQTPPITFRPTEEMNVIWHDDVTANSPAMPAMGHAPFVDQSFGDIVSSKDLSPIIGARLNKWRIDRNTAWPLQMFVHNLFLTGGAASAI